MSITNSSSARRAGFKVNDAAIKENANISMSKIGTRTLYAALPPNAWHLVGTSVAVAEDGIFTTVLMPDANTGSMFTSLRLPAEYDSGNLTLTIYWKTTAVSGAAYFICELGSKIVGESTASVETLTVTTTTASTANLINKSQVSFSSTNISGGDLLGITVQRIPGNAADTLATNLYIVGIVLEYTGRG